MPPSIRISLVAAQVVAAATLLRSVAYDRWITVLMATLLIAGAASARRGRVSGLALTFAAAWWFPTAFAIGIAPAWFCLVGLVGALPFALSYRALSRFDARAAGFLAAIAAATGMAGAMAWRSTALQVFHLFPSLTPSAEAGHGLGIAALLAVAALGATALRARSAPGDAPRVRVAESLGESEPAYTTALGALADEEEEVSAAVAAPRAARR